MSIFKDIKDGWSNYIEAMSPDGEIDPTIEALARARAGHCKDCPELVESGFFKVVNKVFNLGGGKTEKRKLILNGQDHSEKEDWDGKSYKCGQCGCSFPQNVYAPQKTCPLGKW